MNAAAASANGQRINAPPPPPSQQQQQAFQSPGMMRNGAPSTPLGMGLMSGSENIGLSGQRVPGAPPHQPQQPPQQQQPPQPSQPGYPPNMHGQSNGIGPPGAQPQSTPGVQPTMPHPFHMMNQPPSSQTPQQPQSQQQPHQPQQQQQFPSSRAPTPSEQRQNSISQGQQPHPQSASTTPAPHLGMGAQPSPARAMARPQSQPQHGIGLYPGGPPGKNSIPPGGANIFGLGGGAGTSGSTSVPGSGVMVPATIPSQPMPPMNDALKAMFHQQPRDPGQQPQPNTEDTVRTHCTLSDVTLY